MEEGFLQHPLPPKLLTEDLFTSIHLESIVAAIFVDNIYLSSAKSL